MPRRTTQGDVAVHPGRALRSAGYAALPVSTMEEAGLPSYANLHERHSSGQRTALTVAEVMART